MRISKLILTVLNSLCFFLPLLLFSETETFYIEVRTDDNPQEISWTLNTEDGELLLSDESLMKEKRKVYIWKYEIEKDVCARFDIFDSQGNGIDDPGYYRIRRGELWIQGQIRKFKETNYHYSGSCQVGTNCDNPLLVTSNELFINDTSDYWFLFRTETNAHLTINTCNTSSLNSKNILNTKLWVYDGCPTKISDGPEGALIFNDDFVSCAPGAGVANYRMQKDRNYIIRVSSFGMAENGYVAVTFEESNIVLGCMDSLSCSYNPFATEDNGSCLYFYSCAPDLEIDQNEFSRSIFLDSLDIIDTCLIEEFCVNGFGRRDIIRFSTLIRNIGDADYVVGNPDVNDAGFSIDNCHEHWHRLGYAEYLLYEKGGTVLPLGFKNGFCLFDIGCFQEGEAQKYSCDYMGISKGCYDIYDSSVDCQWLDVTDVPDGTYTMVARINWNKLPDLLGRYEKGYDNNWAQACITLDRSNGKLQLTIETNCAEYRDCQGTAFGRSVVDCAGVCGGLSHFGDINQDNELDSADFEAYIQYINDGHLESESCFDLDGSGEITVFDAVLIRECLDNYDNISPTHNHCLFPRSIVDSESDVDISIQNHDIEQKEVTLEYRSDTEIIAFQIDIDGIGQIISSSLDNIDNFYLSANYHNQIIGIGNEIPLQKSSQKTELLVFSYDTLLLENICVQKVIDVISYRNHRISNITTSKPCSERITAIEENVANNNIRLFPNPSSRGITLSGNQVVKKWEIFDNSGIRQISNSQIKNGLLNIDINNLSNGIYFIKFWIGSKSQTIKFLKN